MQIKHISVLFFLSICLAGRAQNTPLSIGDPQTYMWQRLDIKMPDNPILRETTWKPFSRQMVNDSFNLMLNNSEDNNLTPIDEANLAKALAINGYGKKIWHPNFFEDPTHLVDSKNGNAGIIIDPMLSYEIGQDKKGGSLFRASQGLGARGTLGKKWSYYFSYTYNRERDPQYVQDFVNARQGLPGAQTYGTVGKNRNVYEYNDFRGGVAFQATKHVDFKAGYDQFFIGEGIRSLYLSDFAAPFYFIQLHGQVGRVSFSSVAARTIAPFGSVNNGLTNPNSPANLMVFHYVSWQANRWLKLGIYENNMYNMEINGGVQIGMLNPFVFSRAMSQNVGNSGKSSIGVDAKANIAQHFQLYGQLLINEFHVSEVSKFFQRSSWANKQGIQVGGKYIDAFNIKNLDLQGEINAIRPFTYTDKWLVNNFQHDNLPLADPLGANAKEYIASVHYQPARRLYLSAMVMFYKKGLDSASYATASTQQNWGGDIFRSYLDNNTQQDVLIGSGLSAKNLFGQFLISYELATNLFIDGSLTGRKYEIVGVPNDNTVYFNFGFRWNMSRRLFLF
ncbi:MAG: hypothetical protein LBE82_03460 [Chitinophagaceae bacterium]|jgi:hypothetical protein|nr:hypothetical protein [Chitinophagaceae bacterium]